MIYERYLPILLRLQLVDARDSSCFKAHNRGDYNHVPAEIADMRYNETIEQVKTLFPIVNSAHRQFVSDIRATAT